MQYVSKSINSKLKSSRKNYNSALNKGYTSQYADNISGLADQIANRKAFSYDASKDPTYQQYLKSYGAMGSKAMQDTMAQSAALTGGYGNSYGQVAGQIVYDDYMKQAADKIPELYQAAYNMYQSEGEDMYNKLSMYQNLDDSAYSRYNDNLGNLYNRMAYYQGVADNDRAYGYQKATDDRAFNYQVQQDALARLSSGSSSGASSGGSSGSSKKSVSSSKKTTSGIKSKNTGTGLGGSSSEESGSTDYYSEISKRISSTTNDLKGVPGAGVNIAPINFNVLSYINDLYNNKTIDKTTRDALRNFALTDAKKKGVTLGSK